MATKKKAAKRGRPKKVVEPSITDVSAHETPVDEPQPKLDERPAEASVLVIGTYPNPMWLKGVDKNGKPYKIRVPKRFSSKLLHKQVTVHKIDGEPEEYYKYEP